MFALVNPLHGLQSTSRAYLHRFILVNPLGLCTMHLEGYTKEHEGEDWVVAEEM